MEEVNVPAIVEFALREFELAGYQKVEENSSNPDVWMQENVLELLRVFSSQRHSGFSASFCITLFTKLAKWEPISPLTGEESEWTKVTEDLWQNKRCSRVFKDRAKAWDVDGKIFVEPTGSYYASRESSVEITFPYTPKTEYINVKEDDDT